MKVTECANGKRGGDTHRYVGVLVEDDLEEVRRENGRGFKMLLRSEDVLLLPVWTWRGAGQICKRTTVTITQVRVFQGFSYISTVHVTRTAARADLMCRSTPESRPAGRQTPQSLTSSPGSGC